MISGNVILYRKNVFHYKWFSLTLHSKFQYIFFIKNFIKNFLHSSRLIFNDQFSFTKTIKVVDEDIDKC